MPVRMGLLHLLMPLVVAAVTLSAMYSSFTSYPGGVNVPDNDRVAGRRLEVAIVRDARDAPVATFICTPYAGEMTGVSTVDLAAIARCTSVTTRLGRVVDLSGDICLSFMTGHELNFFIACVVLAAPSVSVRDSVVALHSNMFDTIVTNATENIDEALVGN